MFEGHAGVLLLIVLSLALALVHLVADRFPIFGIVPTNVTLSGAGGVSVVYVFVYVLPKLAAHAGDIVVPSGLDDPVYLLLFAGLLAFFGLERLARVADAGSERALSAVIPAEPVFWMHIVGFAVYNIAIGHLLVSGALIDDPVPFAIAMALHLFGNDEALRALHRDAYHRIGRWILAAAVLLGASTAVVVTVSPELLLGILAALAGGITFNALKEELPRDRDSSFWGFATGALAFWILAAFWL